MKKIHLTLIILIFIVQFSFGQWTTNGSATTTSNSVGIGTITPLNGLHIFSNGDFNAGSVRLGYSTTSDAVLSWGWDGISQDAFKISKFPHNSTTGSTNFLTILTNTGYAGIGTQSPLTRLHIVGSGSSVDGGNAFSMNGDDMAIQANTGGRSTTTGAQLEFVIPANTDGTNLWGQARIITVAGSSLSSDATGKMILGTRRSFNKLGTGPQWYYGNDIVIDGNGNVGIGTPNPQGYLLAVAGSAIATSMTIKTVPNWPDYVLKKNYRLPTLQEVKTYIDQNQHLPDMPSEQEIAKDGLNLGEMNKLLVKKVEELTLYLIEQKKEITDQQKVSEIQHLQIVLNIPNKVYQHSALKVYHVFRMKPYQWLRVYNTLDVCNYYQY